MGAGEYAIDGIYGFSTVYLPAISVRRIRCCSNRNPGIRVDRFCNPLPAFRASVILCRHDQPSQGNNLENTVAFISIVILIFRFNPQSTRLTETR